MTFRGLELKSILSKEAEQNKIEVCMYMMHIKILMNSKAEIETHISISLILRKSKFGGKLRKAV